MGAWDHSNFGNDTAHDFVYEVTEQGMEKIIHAIKTAAECPGDEYLESDEANEALAAIEFIAAAKGNMAEDFPENAEDWLAGKNVDALISADIISESDKALARIKSDNSELKDLWQDSEHYNDWINVVDNLLSRIK
jgi:hypothetical protein